MLLALILITAAGCVLGGGFRVFILMPAAVGLALAIIIGELLLGGQTAYVFTVLFSLIALEVGYVVGMIVRQAVTRRGHPLEMRPSFRQYEPDP